ncbi:MAG: hypothetical protein PHO80_02820 [Candidatus Gracilibacteria bacterium]|nr:hypothetical protein [Candidatus Gracilibacteria bacterium]
MYSDRIKNNFLGTIKNFNIEEAELNQFNNYMNNLFIKINIHNFENENLKNEILDFICWYGLIKYIYEIIGAYFLPKSYNFIEVVLKNIENAEYLWYEIYYRYLLIYLEELLNSILDNSYYGFIIHYRQIIELDLFLQTYNNLNKNDKVFYGIISYSLYFGGGDLLNTTKGDLSNIIDFNSLKEKIFLPLFYGYIPENEKKKYEEKEKNIFFTKINESNIFNKILFSLKRGDSKIRSIKLDDELNELLKNTYNFSDEYLVEKYGEPSKIIHPNNFSILNNGNKFSLECSNLELYIGRLNHLNNIHIPIILNIFSGNKININGVLK